MEKRLITSESVTEGHPDKLCDQISDGILDAFLQQDPQARVAVEAVASDKLIFIAGEVASTACVDIAKVARAIIAETGYTDEKLGLDSKTCIVLTNINQQSADIALGVNTAREYKTDNRNWLESLGAGDQGMMIGFACRETPDYLPLPIYLAHRLTERLAAVRKRGLLPYLRPDGKAQVTVEYDAGGRPVRLDTIVLAAQHDPDVGYDRLCGDLAREVIQPVLSGQISREGVKIYINPTGRFVIGGPKADTGLTGRKIIVDTYGSFAKHGGGAFSGKDPTKVDRSAAYMARYAAKNLVAAQLAGQCEITLAYAIGMAHPVAINVNTFGSEKIPVSRIGQLLRQCFDFRPGFIIRELDLLRPIYRNTAAYGHFGRPEKSFPWEALDKVELLKKTAFLPEQRFGAGKKITEF
jgi:S-adenosylmethionine synthetase